MTTSTPDRVFRQRTFCAQIVILPESLVNEVWQASGGSAGARNIVTMVTKKRVKLGRWLAGNLMKELDITSCQRPVHHYKRGGNERIDIPNLLERLFAVTRPDQVW